MDELLLMNLAQRNSTRTKIFRRQSTLKAREENAGEYTPEEWAAWDAGAYDSIDEFEDGGAQEEFVDDSYYAHGSGLEYDSDDY
ncbi:hypothetical protein CYMTET_21324 [Cymbomonas tetramitiformis]|uniref:Uncharacterized protein n=1 Tax=Cymbomonas tetramitiformis TaxID=36881 RepID=A0AAE0L3E0_9CHLO|nr:hypothetical protein CYMTET_21324 [Cymbomonas tetramitiformis]